MPSLIILDKILKAEKIVICDSDMAVKAHQGLFSCKDEAYINLLLNHSKNQTVQSIYNDSGEIFLSDILNIFDSCKLHSTLQTFDIHLVLNWEHLLQIALWSKKVPLMQNIFQLLLEVGLFKDELLDIKWHDTNQIFKHLLDTRRFDIFRRICHYARGQLINHVSVKSMSVVTFLFSPITKTIVASSL